MIRALFPVAMIALSLCAAAVYAVNRDIRHTVYWIASAVIIGAVTF